VSDDLEKVRERVRQEFSKFGWAGDEVISESILLEDLSYVGHRFEFSQWHVEWRIGSHSADVCLGNQRIGEISLEAESDCRRAA